MNIKKELKGIATLTLCAILITSVLAGCGTAAQSKPADEPTTATEEAAQETAAAPAAQDASVTSVEITAAESTTQVDASEAAETKPAASEPAATKPVAAQALIATDKDLEILAKLCATGWFPEEGYTAGKTGQAYSCISFDLVEYCAETYGMTKPEYFHEENDVTGFKTPDPLKKIHACAYARLDGKTVDWILKNILNAEPDHAYIKESEYEKGSYDWYYKDGNYYFDCGCGWNSYKASVDSKTQNSDGSYTCKLTVYDEFVDSKDKAADGAVTATLLEVDGQRVWRLTSASTNYVEDN